MKNKAVLKHYKAPPQKSGAISIASYIFIPISIFGIYSLSYKYLWFLISVNEFKNKPFIDRIGFFIVILIFIYFLFFLIHRRIEFMVDIFSVDLCEDRIIGYTYYKKKQEIAYSDILAIKKNKWPKLYLSLELVLKNGKKVILNGGMNRYGDLIEEIRKRSPNLEKVDYGGIDKNPRAWNDQRWDDDGKPIRR